MTSVRKCLRCGADVHPDAPGGLCPRCLVGLSFVTETEIPSEAEPGNTRSIRGSVEEPRSIDEVAKLFPRLEILKYLGRGGMGLVYQARQAPLDRFIALKILPQGKEADARFTERFAREARALARLNHPNIVSVHDFGEVAGHCYLLIEFVDGVNLRQLLQTGKITPEQALTIVPRICDALQYAHGQGVVHRDIKPENILLDKQGQVKITDFGIAKILEHKPGVLLLTEDTQRIGTPHYMAPEQVEKPQSVDHRADIYSLGVVFYEMLTGELPLGRFAPPSQRAGTDARLDQVVFHALEKDPEHRYQHAREVKTDVETITSSVGRSEPSELLVGQPSSTFTGRAWPRVPLWLGTLGAATLIIVLLLLFGKQMASRFGGQTNPPFPAAAAEITFPADAGVVDVTKPPYNAVGDGNNDSTAAIQKALTDFCGRHAIIYVPKGIYLLSAPLRWGGGACDFQGHGSDSTILRLKNACPGFGDPATPQAVLSTGLKGTEGYFNSLRSFTVDTGTNNRGAVGLQFAASWVGCVRDVEIHSSDGQGVTGLDLAHIESIGSLLVKNVTVRGFGIGIHCKEVLLSLAFEHIRLEDQQQVAFLNDGPSVGIRQLFMRGSVPGFRNDGQMGLAVIVDSEFQGVAGAKAQSAIINGPGMFVRNVRVTGFAQAIAHNGAGATNIPCPTVKEWTSRLLPGSNPSLDLPVEETPELPWDALPEWSNPVAFGANPFGASDASEGIQRAIDSGKRIVYLPRGEYVLQHPILLRGKMARFIGCGAVLHLRPSDGRSPIFALAEGEAPVVLLERLQVDSPDSVLPHWFVDKRSRRRLVLRDCGGADSEFTGPGDIFLENVSGRMSFQGQRVWARQISQGGALQLGRQEWWHLRNASGQLWILSQMTQGPGPIISTSSGGRSELLGGLTYSSAGADAQPEPAFVADQSALSVSLNEVSHANFAYAVLVRSISSSGQSVDVLTPDQAPGGASGSLIPHFATK